MTYGAEGSGKNKAWRCVCVWMRHTDNKHGIVKIYIAHEVENKTMRVVTCFLHDYMYFRFFLQASINFLVSR